MDLDELIINTTEASELVQVEAIQTLWSGYGEIKRYHLNGGKYASVIVKHIKWSDYRNHPKGWNTDLSHQRKLKSYQVESNWYQYHAKKAQGYCKVPKIYHALIKETEILLIMEDLDESGYHIRLTPDSVTLKDALNCLTWLAKFHARFVATESSDLWEIGTYWHLDTRPDELERMVNIKLKKSAKAIDQHLNSAQFQTLVHGDAKLANFCFSEADEVAVVDFQYVGKGCGMKDVAYFISSCFDDTYIEMHEAELLNHYFKELELALGNAIDFQLIKSEWSSLYKYAWADFYRFLDGWSPGHWKMHGYSRRLTNETLKELRK